MVYKLVEMNGIPKIKLSEDKEKVLIPGRKNVFRIYSGNGPEFDILINQEEQDIKIGKVTAYNPFTEASIEIDAVRVEKLTTVLFEDGKEVVETHGPMNVWREHVLSNLHNFDQDVIMKNKEFKIYTSERVMKDLNRLWQKSFN